ncbi:hypothetical protein ACF1BP_36745 [Streptomyces sp. NPDC014735]|uniref:hypothetical protein n=1 Tax=unclassified Streptomyces TaxID=2593676 RepID=UPI00093FBEEA|nr:hypothetical protein [Streptomyces sp. CB01580]OKJ18968.1 hypothetical protein AMK22_35345 [Streptomyces sp. CB01580]
MRIRHALTGAALGAVLLTGGTAATAQAAFTPSQATATYTDIGTFKTENACKSFGRAGVYRDWFCKPSTTTTNWHLMVNLNS